MLVGRCGTRAMIQTRGFSRVIAYDLAPPILASNLLDALDALSPRRYADHTMAAHALPRRQPRKFLPGLGNEAARLYAEELVAHLLRGIEERSMAYHQHGRSLGDMGSPDELAQKMLAAFPEPSRWDDLLGPFFTTGQMTRLLGGISRQALAERRERRTVLGLMTADGVVVYPTFQLDTHNRVLPGLSEVLRSFDPTAVDEWTLAGWLVARHGALGERSVVEWLRQERDLAPLLALARDASRRFEQ